MFYRDSEHVYRARPLERFDWLVHGFGTRWSKNFGSCRNLATLRQVHSNRTVNAQGRAGCLGEGDALLDNAPGILLAVRTADCLPILLVDARNRAVAAVHAGWRGTVNEIARETIRALQEKFSTRVQDLHAAIGPGIGACCFEVGAEVSAQFGFSHARSRTIDLAEVNRRQLITEGLAPDQIYSAALCTFCLAQDFHSYRREKDVAGRMLSVVGVNASPSTSP